MYQMTDQHFGMVKKMPQAKRLGGTFVIHAFHILYFTIKNYI